MNELDVDVALCCVLVAESDNPGPNVPRHVPARKVPRSPNPPLRPFGRHCTTHTPTVNEAVSCWET